MHTYVNRCGNRERLPCIFIVQVSCEMELQVSDTGKSLHINFSGSLGDRASSWRILTWKMVLKRVFINDPG